MNSVAHEWPSIDLISVKRIEKKIELFEEVIQFNPDVIAFVNEMKWNEMRGFKSIQLVNGQEY